MPTRRGRSFDPELPPARGARFGTAARAHRYTSTDSWSRGERGPHSSPGRGSTAWSPGRPSCRPYRAIDSIAHRFFELQCEGEPSISLPSRAAAGASRGLADLIVERRHGPSRSEPIRCRPSAGSSPRARPPRHRPHRRPRPPTARSRRRSSPEPMTHRPGGGWFPFADRPDVRSVGPPDHTARSSAALALPASNRARALRFAQLYGRSSNAVTIARGPCSVAAW
jgi:hypothetical protein